MSFQATPADVSVIISTASATQSASNEPSLATERRITPSWSIDQLKRKLETMTGVPPGSQRLLFKSPGRPDQWIEGQDRLIGEWGLVRGCEIEVHDTRPVAARPNFTDLSSVEKYELPAEKYNSLNNSVLAWKKSQKLGRFDPNAQSPEDLLHQQVGKDIEAIEKKNIKLLARAIILPSSPPHIRRGTIRYIGPVTEIPFAPLKDKKVTTEDGHPLEPFWVGIELDEPTGKNDGSIAGKRYFECSGNNRGVFVKPEKVEVGDFPPLDLDLELDDDMEEI